MEGRQPRHSCTRVQKRKKRVQIQVQKPRFLAVSKVRMFALPDDIMPIKGLETQNQPFQHFRVYQAFPCERSKRAYSARKPRPFGGSLMTDAQMQRGPDAGHSLAACESLALRRAQCQRQREPVSVGLLAEGSAEEAANDRLCVIHQTSKSRLEARAAHRRCLLSCQRILFEGCQ